MVSHVGRKLKLPQATLKHTPLDAPGTEISNAVYRMKIHSAVYEIREGTLKDVVKIFYRKFLNLVYIKRQAGSYAAHCASQKFSSSNAYNSGTETDMKIRFSQKWRSGTDL